MSTQARVIPFIRQQDADLRRLSARRGISVLKLIAWIVGDYLHAVQWGRPAQLPLPTAAPTLLGTIGRSPCHN